MKKKIMFLIIISALTLPLAFTLAVAEHHTPAERGKIHFNNPDFAGGKRSCNSCHPNGKGLDEEGPPKTKKSKRDIDILPPAYDALMRQKELTGKSKYVFLDDDYKPLTTDHVRNVIWTPALEQAGIEYRTMLQTRHTFATMMIDAGEDLGWVQNQLGHASLQMIYTRYYSWVKKDTRNDGSAFMKRMYDNTFRDNNSDTPQAEKLVNFTPILHQHKKRVSS